MLDILKAFGIGLVLLALTVAFLVVILTYKVLLVGFVFFMISLALTSLGLTILEGYRATK